MGTRKDRAVVATVLAAPATDYNGHLEKLQHLAERAARQGAAYVCFPEYYCLSEPDETGRMIRGVSDDGPTARALTAIAREHDLAIVIGVTERATNRRYPIFDFYNTALFIDGDGVQGRHRKVFLWIDSERPGKDPEEEKRRVDPHDIDSTGNSYPYGENMSYLPGRSFECLAFGGLQRAGGMICADGLYPLTWSHLIPQSPQIIFYPNGRENLLKNWGPDFGYVSKEYRVPIVASNKFMTREQAGCPVVASRMAATNEAGIYDSDGTCVARIEGKEGVVAAEVTLGKEQPYRPVRMRHWDGDALENLHRLDKF